MAEGAGGGGLVSHASKRSAGGPRGERAGDDECAATQVRALGPEIAHQFTEAVHYPWAVLYRCLLPTGSPRLGERVCHTAVVVKSTRGRGPPVLLPLIGPGKTSSIETRRRNRSGVQHEWERGRRRGKDVAAYTAQAMVTGATERSRSLQQRTRAPNDHGQKKKKRKKSGEKKGPSGPPPMSLRPSRPHPHTHRQRLLGNDPHRPPPLDDKPGLVLVAAVLGDRVLVDEIFELHIVVKAGWCGRRAPRLTATGRAKVMATEGRKKRGERRGKEGAGTQPCRSDRHGKSRSAQRHHDPRRRAKPEVRTPAEHTSTSDTPHQQQTSRQAHSPATAAA